MHKIFSKIATISLLLGLVFLANSLFATQAEQLYPVTEIENEDLEVKVARPEAEQLKAKVPTEKEANRFVPILSETKDQTVLPKIIDIEEPGISKSVLAAKLDERPIKLSAFSNQPGPVNTTDLNQCKALVEQTLTALPSHLTASLDELTLYFSERNPRGLSNNHIIQLRCHELPEKEIVSVFVHELGHIVDLGYLDGSSATASNFADGKYVIPADDLSVQFYKLSWQDEKTQRRYAKRLDFVSGYAMSDAFEDFAESFNFYVLHGEDFRQLAQESNVLRMKYDFIKKHIFAGKEFESERVTKDEKRVWDSTLLDFSLNAFFKQYLVIAEK